MGVYARKQGFLMGVFGEIGSWLTDPANWSGPNAIPGRVLEHTWMSALSVFVAALIMLPVALYIGHTGRFRFMAVTLANLGRAVPSFAILALALPISLNLKLGLGFYPTITALVALALPPILTNTYVGIASVDKDLVEAARGMGMSEREVLFSVEVPVAAPLIVAGLRVAAVQVVATATLAAIVAWGGLGRYIIDGFAVRDFGRIGGGAVLVASLALLTELCFGLLERSVTQRGRSGRRQTARDVMIEVEAQPTST